MSDEIDLGCYHWLVSSSAEPWFQFLAESKLSLPQQTTRLRKELSPAQTHLLLEQHRLRQRGRSKFTHADRMFFTAKGFEQATDEVIAGYKAARFGTSHTYDFCCGIGGDLLALAQRGATTGVDSDPVTALLAGANLQALAKIGASSSDSFPADSAKIQCSTTQEIFPGSSDCWHLDPDRRPSGKRTTELEFHQPGPEEITRLLAHCNSGAVKLAPATIWPTDQFPEVELEWIGYHRECKQQIAWCGKLARYTGRRCATILGSKDSTPRTVVSNDRDSGTIEPCQQIGRYLFEPHAAVLAAKLSSTLSAEHQLHSVRPDIAYLTGDTFCQDPALSVFEVLEVLPFDRKRLKKLLAARNIGQLEVKKRGVDLEPATLQRQLGGSGTEAGTLLLFPFRGQTTAVLATRMQNSA